MWRWRRMRGEGEQLRRPLEPRRYFPAEELRDGSVPGGARMAVVSVLIGVYSGIELSAQSGQWIDEIDSIRLQVAPEHPAEFLLLMHELCVARGDAARARLKDEFLGRKHDYQVAHASGVRSSLHVIDRREDELSTFGDTRILEIERGMAVLAREDRPESAVIEDLALPGVSAGEVDL